MIGAFFLANCRSENPPPPVEAKTREITDDLGRRIKIPENVERAVSLAPNLTENVFAVGAGDKLVGATSFATTRPKRRKSGASAIR